jgi:phenylpropionate dioxygenase-like ring-hydroxylating dioxygenase large terminal subunit
MLKNYWYAVEFGAAVQDTPVQVRVFDQDLVLYRNSQGEIVCHSDICIHRGGSLAGGKVHGDCISCPYHGWQFDEQGACVKIPANRAGLPIPKKARVDTYPVVERYGYVFVFLGDLPEAERPPMPVLPLLEPTSDARATDNRIITGQFEWKANYERVLENGVDAAHAPFVHSTSFGNPDKPEIEDFDLQESVVGGHLTSAVYTVHLEPPEPKGIWKLIAKKNAVRPPIETGNGLYFPNVTFLQVKLPLGTMTLFTAVVPVDETHSISKWTMCRDFFTKPWQVALLRADKDSYKRTMKIFYEDQPTVEGQRPELIPVDLSSELQVKSDAVQLAYRRWRLEALNRGWGIDEHLVGLRARYQGARVIPSPARREHPELANAWVLKEMESNQAQREQAAAEEGQNA